MSGVAAPLRRLIATPEPSTLLAEPARTPARDRQAEPRAALGLALLSGFAGLGYEIVWTEQLGIWLGHEFVAVLGVLGAFFGGLALGAVLLAGRIEQSRRPGLWYVGCEAVCAGWALVLAFALPPAAAALTGWLGAEPAPVLHWSAAFFGPLLLLAPATCALGASLPALERTLGRGPGAGYGIGSLYAANTFGAVLGVLAAAFVLVPALGLANTACACASLDAVCAGLGAALYGGRAAVPSRLSARGREPKLLLLLGATGALGIGYEVLVVRVLGQVTEDTTYTFAILLAVYLLGVAAGGAVHQRWLQARAGGAFMREGLLAATAVACALGALTLGMGASWPAAVQRLASQSVGRLGAALLGETLVAVAAFLLPAIAMGALFSELCAEAKRRGLSFGVALASNTLGAALAPALFAVGLLPALGAKAALSAVVISYAALVPLRSWRDARPLEATALALGLGLAALAFTPPFAAARVPEGGRLVHFEEGIGAAVSVLEDARGVQTLHINGRAQEGSNMTLLADARQAWLPLLLVPEARRALFLGLGTGVTAGAAAWDPELRVDAVELLPEVIAASARFVPVLESPLRPRVIAGDARRYVRAAGPAYDVVVADLFHPARSGSGALYTAEHFAAVRGRLASGGVFCQWLPLHQLDLGTLGSIVHSFLSAFPAATALLATHSLETPVLGLVGWQGAAGVDRNALAERLARLASAARLPALHLEDELAVLGSFVSGPRALAALAATAPANTDDRPIVTRRAPWATYAPELAPRERLLALLGRLQVEPRDVLAASSAHDIAFSERLGAYWAARDRFIALGATVQPSSDAAEMLARVGAPLLAIVRASPDFRPAYDPLLNLASALAASRPGAAKALLIELAGAQPERPEAALWLEHLANAPVSARLP